MYSACGRECHLPCFAAIAERARFRTNWSKAKRIFPVDLPAVSELESSVVNILSIATAFMAVFLSMEMPDGSQGAALEVYEGYRAQLESSGFVVEIGSERFQDGQVSLENVDIFLPDGDLKLTTKSMTLTTEPDGRVRVQAPRLIMTSVIPIDDGISTIFDLGELDISILKRPSREIVELSIDVIAVRIEGDFLNSLTNINDLNVNITSVLLPADMKSVDLSVALGSLGTVYIMDSNPRFDCNYEAELFSQSMLFDSGVLGPVGRDPESGVFQYQEGPSTLDVYYICAEHKVGVKLAVDKHRLSLVANPPEEIRLDFNLSNMEVDASSTELFPAFVELLFPIRVESVDLGLSYNESEHNSQIGVLFHLNKLKPNERFLSWLSPNDRFYSDSMSLYLDGIGDLLGKDFNGLSLNKLDLDLFDFAVDSAGEFSGPVYAPDSADKVANSGNFVVEVRNLHKMLAVLVGTGLLSTDTRNEFEALLRLYVPDTSPSDDFYQFFVEFRGPRGWFVNDKPI